MILNFLYIITGLIGYIISIILLANKKSNPMMNMYMILLIFIISCRFFIYGSINLISNQEITIYYAKYSNLTFVVIPICYLYFKKMESKKTFAKKDLLHFIFPFFYFISTFEIGNYYKPNFSLKLVFYLFFLGFLISYLYLSYTTLKDNIWNKQEENKIKKKQFKKKYDWTLFLFVALVLASIRLAIAIFIELLDHGVTRGLSYQWISSIIWIVILIKIIITPEILYGYKILNEKVLEDRNSSLTFNNIWQLHSEKEIKNVQHLALKEKVNQNLQNYFEEIEKKSLSYDFFRNPKLTISDFATRLNIPKSHLSYIFKYHSTISFSEYKKIIRIHDAIKLIDNGYLKNNTLDSLSKKIGFTSYNPFFTSFKEITGFAPVEYINNIKNIA